MLTDEQKASALARYQQHRRAWEQNAALRTLYRGWYERIGAALPDPMLGPFVEIGSGPGFARWFIPGLRLSDVVRAPWHDCQLSADRLPFADETVGALVLFDVLHHLAAPSCFFAEAARVLVPGGRIVLCEPYLSVISFPVYRFLHEEPVILGVDPLEPVTVRRGWADQEQIAKDPFDSNQAIPTLIFDRRRGREAFARKFPDLAVGAVEKLAGLAYPTSGGFGRAPLVPMRLWHLLHALERRLPAWVYRWVGFRMMVVIDKKPSTALRQGYGGDVRGYVSGSYQ